MIALFVHFIAFVLLIAYWLVSDAEGRTKLIVTLIYLGTWIFLFIDGFLFLGAQALFALVIGSFTFVGRR